MRDDQLILLRLRYIVQSRHPSSFQPDEKIADCLCWMRDQTAVRHQYDTAAQCARSGAALRPGALATLRRLNLRWINELMD